MELRLWIGRVPLIYVTRLDGSELVVNAELIETVEQRPDTVISLATGHKLVVQEPVTEIIERVIAYRQRTYRLAVGQAKNGESS